MFLGLIKAFETYETILICFGSIVHFDFLGKKPLKENIVVVRCVRFTMSIIFAFKQLKTADQFSCLRKFIFFLLLLNPNTQGFPFWYSVER